MESMIYGTDSRNKKRKMEYADNRISKFGYDIREIASSLKMFIDSIANLERELQVNVARKEKVETGQYVASVGEYGEKVKAMKLGVMSLQFNFIQKELTYFKVKLNMSAKIYQELKKHPKTPNAEKASDVQRHICDMYKENTKLKLVDFYTQTLNAVFALDKADVLEAGDEAKYFPRFKSYFEMALTKTEHNDNKAVQQVCEVINNQMPQLNLKVASESENN